MALSVVIALGSASAGLAACDSAPPDPAGLQPRSRPAHAPAAPSTPASSASPATSTALAAAAPLASATALAAAAPLASAASLEQKDGMVHLPGGTYWMGSQDSVDDALPVHQVTVSPFWIDRTEVTNEQFDAFTRATKYRTIAERSPDPKQFPGVPKDKLVPGSLVFAPPPGGASLDDASAWWRWVPGASWKHPEGPDSTIAGREKHPVVQIAWGDAVAYAKWAGKRLPTEAEWEYAARGGLDRKRYVWGDEQRPGGVVEANSFQGKFPSGNTAEDGYRATAPVASYPPNGFGLFDMSGNAWEWVSDWYRADYYKKSPLKDPEGPADSLDPSEPGTPKRVQRGGSFLCSEMYCRRYVPGARGKGEPDTSLSHTGFRCVRPG